MVFVPNMKTLRAIGGLAAGVALSFATLGSAYAADHRDGPVVQQDSAADINDVFAWMSSDAQRVNLVMTVHPDATEDTLFSDAVTYTFHTNGQAAFLGTRGASNDIRCTFEVSQEITCKLGDVVVSGDASSTTGIMSANGEMRVFAGLRDDPFFFNGAGFRATAEIVAGAAAGLTFGEQGCPILDEATSNLLVTQLSTAPDGGAAVDGFANFNTQAIVLSVDKSLLTGDGAILSVWGSSTRRQLVQ